MRVNFPQILVVVGCLATISAAAQNADTNNTSPFPQPRPVNSESEFKPHFGLLMGVVHPEGSYTDARELGLELGLQPYIPFSSSIELNNNSIQSEPNGERLERTTLLLKGAYNFGGQMMLIKDSYVGLGVGPVFKSGRTEIAMAPVLGFDIPVTDRSADRSFVSLGAHAKYSITSGSDPDSVSLNGVLKYWY